MSDEKRDMMEEYEQKRRKQVSAMRSAFDYGIGLLICTAGVFFFIRDRLDIQLNDIRPPDYVDKIFGVMCICYGIWRIYRGYKKNYFK